MSLIWAREFVYISICLEAEGKRVIVLHPHNRNFITIVNHIRKPGLDSQVMEHQSTETLDDLLAIDRGRMKENTTTFSKPAMISVLLWDL